jgi:Uma2 family endonuclease
MVSQAKPYYTEEEYLKLERAAEYKSEYFAGEIFAMSGATATHNIIAGNIFRHIGNLFEATGRPCRVYIGDMRVRVTPTGLYTYPDVMAICGPQDFADNRQDTLLNPTVIFEVLSPSTESYDRGQKFAHYWALPSLTDYVLVAQNQVRVEHYTRQDNGWLLTAFTTLDATLHLPSIEATLPLARIYLNAELPPPDTLPLR